VEAKMTEAFDWSGYFDDQIDLYERILKNARRATIVPAPDGYDHGDIIDRIERELAELQRLRQQEARKPR
jgi:hypothetical protein